MALFIPSPLVSDIRGSIGGLSFGRTSAGPTVFTKPTQLKKHTSSQCTWLTNFNYISIYWKLTLSIANKMLWDEYAKTLQFNNRLSSMVSTTGKNIFVKVNLLRYLTGQAIAITPPTADGFAITIIPNTSLIALSAATSRLTLTTGAFTGFSETSASSKIIVYYGSSHTYTRNIQTKNMKYLGYFSGAGVGGGFSPAFLTIPISIRSGYYCDFKFVHYDNLGRFSNEILFQKVVAA